MAKVRIQARSADTDDAVEDKFSLPRPHQPHHSKGRHAHSGAIDILKRVWKTEGFAGWYQVRPFFRWAVGYGQTISHVDYGIRAWALRYSRRCSHKGCYSCPKISSRPGLWSSWRSCIVSLGSVLVHECNVIADARLLALPVR
jgi:hypothetical protein